MNQQANNRITLSERIGHQELALLMHRRYHHHPIQINGGNPPKSDHHPISFSSPVLRYSSSQEELQLRRVITRTYRKSKVKTSADSAPKTSADSNYSMALPRKKVESLPLVPEPPVKQPKMASKQFVFNFVRKSKILVSRQDGLTARQPNKRVIVI